MNFKKWLENSMQAMVATMPGDNKETGGEVPNSMDVDTMRDPATGRVVPMKSAKADNLFVHRVKKQNKK